MTATTTLPIVPTSNQPVTTVRRFVDGELPVAVPDPVRPVPAPAPALACYSTAHIRNHSERYSEKKNVQFPLTAASIIAPHGTITKIHRRTKDDTSQYEVLDASQ